MSLLHQGNKRRTTEATNANITSSRSHAIFQIVVEIRDKAKNTKMDVLSGKLSLIDLAGSERGSVTENRGIRLREGAKINRSLLALANCINALGDKAKKGFYIPYRDSKLTRMLKDSLGGNCKTVMVVCVSPASSQYEETINTLKYASRAKNIKQKVLPNKKLVNVHISEYKNIINELRNEIDALRAQIQYQELHPTSQQNDQASKICHCGRGQEEIECKKLQAEIFESFQERIQIRRALMELEEQNSINALEIKRRKVEVIMWKKKERGLTEQEQSQQQALSVEIRNAIKDIQTIEASTAKNYARKQLMTQQLQENVKQIKNIHDSLNTRIKSQDKRELLEIIIKNHILELQNVELELQLQIQEKAISDLTQLVNSQREMLQKEQVKNSLTIDKEFEKIQSGSNIILQEDMEQVTEEELKHENFQLEEEEEEAENQIDNENNISHSSEEQDLLLSTHKLSQDIDSSAIMEIRKSRQAREEKIRQQGEKEQPELGLIIKPLQKAQVGSVNQSQNKNQDNFQIRKGSKEDQSVGNIGMGLVINGKVMEDGLNKIKKPGFTKKQENKVPQGRRGGERKK